MTYRYLAILVVLEIIFTTSIYAAFHPVAYNGDALYEAQVARNVLAGKGYVTSEMPLYAVNLYKELGLSLEPPWVNTHKFPLPVYLKAGFIKVFGDSLASVTFLYSYVFHFLALLLIFFMGRMLWPARPAFAFFAALLFLVNPVLGFGTPYIMMSGLNLITDAFLFLLLLTTLLYWRERRNPWLLFTAGLVSGVAFLNRYNVGLYIVAVCTLLAYLLVLHRDRAHSLRDSVLQFARSYALYLSGFVLVALGLIAWSARVTGHAFLSINGLFQLLFDTAYNSFIDPWYKLSYVFPTDKPFLFALDHVGTLAVKWFEYAALDVVRFLAFEGVFWWLPLTIIYGFFALTVRDSVTRSINLLLLVTASLVVLQVVLLPLWAGSVAYFIYLFPVFCFAIAYGLLKSYELWITIAGTFPEKLSHIGSALASCTLRTIAGQGFVILMILVALSILVLTTVAAVFAPLEVSFFLIILCTLFVIGGLLVCALALPRYTPHLCVLVTVCAFMAHTGIVTAPPVAEIMKQRWDLEENMRNIHILESLGRGGVSLSATPWNTVWWSDNRVAALPIPQYPDEIYVLAHHYDQRIDSVYLNKIRQYPFEFISYAWAGYERSVQYGYGFEGLDVAARSDQGIILGRTHAVLPYATEIIDFGTQSANSHLIWGWGPNERDGVRDYVAAGDHPYLSQEKVIFQGTRQDEKKIAQAEDAVVPYPITVLDSQSTTEYDSGIPHAEVTFLVSSDRVPRRMEIVVRQEVVGADLLILLNGNLLYVGEPAIDLGVYELTPEWQTLSVEIPSETLREGINKLSFIFFTELEREERNYASFDYVRFKH